MDYQQQFHIISDLYRESREDTANINTFPIWCYTKIYTKMFKSKDSLYRFPLFLRLHGDIWLFKKIYYHTLFSYFLNPSLIFFKLSFDTTIEIKRKQTNSEKQTDVSFN